MSTVYTLNGKVLKNAANDKWLKKAGLPPIPANTVRVRTNDGNAPVKTNASYETATLVAGTTDVYDVYKSGTSFYNLLNYSSNVIEVLGANTSNITDMRFMFSECAALTTVQLFDTSNATNMNGMFYDCYSLTSVPLFDTSNTTNMSNMFCYCEALTTVPLFDTSNATGMYGTFYECSKLTAVPLFNTSKVTDMTKMFYNCIKVESGALALYQQASSQTTPPSSHSSTFYRCGSSTVTGAAELAQIPSSWGGTGA